MSTLDGRTAKQLRVRGETLRAFCERALRAVDVPPEDAAIVADVLVAADLRGIDSHGVARLRRYTDGVRRGIMSAHPTVRVLAETPATAVLDADAGLGQPVSYRAMKRAIEKAQAVGVGVVAVRNSNHFGIAGYYAMLALEHDCIGMATTNAGRLVIPTFGREPMLGTNPIAVAAPAGSERPYVLDMATSTAAMGKIEIYDRLGLALPLGWAADRDGLPLHDAHQARTQLSRRAGGGLLPLGGASETTGGHKGYGLSLLVDILCGVLAGAAYSDRIMSEGVAAGVPTHPNLGHVFAALRVDAFRPLGEFEAAMDDLQRRIKESPKAAGHERIYIHGEKEAEALAERSRLGIPLDPHVTDDLRSLAQELDVPFDLE
jgi:L-2-hydroxycarboxylate dehydrogenase (NAD+)